MVFYLDFGVCRFYAPSQSPVLFVVLANPEVDTVSTLSVKYTLVKFLCFSL